MQRVVVVGTSGSGKTTLARNLACRLGVPHVEMDALHWEPNWQMASIPVFRERVSAALASDSWVTDGNYSKVRDIVWSRADTVVFLDYGFPLVMRRLFWRTVRRAVRGEELWNGNRESLAEAFFSRDSILLWALQTYRKNRRRYAELFQQPEYRHLRIVHLHSPREAERWLDGILPCSRLEGETTTYD
ncbi:MAG TPA: AAA family ATPase [Chloroflexota bacterium]|nr:AAA family ATPase [Chloroflexota bacterium]